MRINDVKDEVRVLPRPRRDVDADPLDFFRRVAQPRGVEKRHALPRDLDLFRDRVARRAGRRRHDRAVAPDERVEERRLPGVRAAEDRDDGAPFARSARRFRESLELPADRGERLARAPRLFAFHVLGEVQRPFERRERVERPLARVVHPARKRALHEAERAACRSAALGPRERREALGLREVELPVRERAPRELPAFGGPGARPPRRVHDAGDDARRAVAEQLDDLLAGGRARRLPEHRDGAVQRAAVGVDEAQEERLARDRFGGKVGCEAARHAERPARRARQPDDGERGDARRRRGRDEHVVPAFAVAGERRHARPAGLRTPSASSTKARGP